MALTKIRVGEHHTLTHAEGHGQGVGALPTGTTVRVESVHSEPTAGVGGDILALVTSEHGKGRRLSFHAADFERMFTKNTKTKDK